MQLKNLRHRPRFRLRTIFLIVNLAVLLLPLGSMFFFRIYENMLVRQTETELIAQAAVLAASYKNELEQRLQHPDSFGKPITDYNPQEIDEYYTPVFPHIDLAHSPTLPARPDGKALGMANPISTQAGKAMEPILQETKKTNLTGILLLDYQGIAVAAHTEVGLSFMHVREVSQALKGRYSSAIRERALNSPTPAIASISRGTGIRVFAAFPVMYHDRLWGVVYLSRTPQNILKHLYDEQEKVLIAGLTILALTLTLAFFTTRTVTRPIDALMEEIRRVRSNEQKTIKPLKHPGTYEVELLADSFAAMTKTLNERSEYIREFATHVSHEFKTPLTSIQGAAELLLEHTDDMPPAKRRKFLTNITEDTDRLKRLVTRLLELARADSTTPTHERTLLAPILKKLQSRYEGRLTIEADIPAAMTVNMAADNLETVFINLLDNAQQHGATKAAISSHQQQGLIVTVADNGRGVSAANRDKIFTPFFTTEREAGGTGIGLGIIQSILVAHGGYVRLGNSTSGALFELHFPAENAS